MAAACFGVVGDGVAEEVGLPAVVVDGGLDLVEEEGDFLLGV